METLVDLLLEGGRAAPPDKLAVRSERASMRYDELLAGARAIAEALHDAGVDRGDRVAVWMEKTPRCVQALLGILFAGACYVPLDPRAPVRRCRAIVEDCDVAALVVDPLRAPQLPALLASARPRVVLFDGPESEMEDDLPARCEPLPSAIDDHGAEVLRPEPEDLAYILYTSGSTGTPKGVMHTHASGLAFVRWVQERFGIRPDDVFSSHAPFHFDLSISDLWASLGAGASVHLVTTTESMLAPYLVNKVGDWGITVWYSVPSALIAMMEAGGLDAVAWSSVRTVLFAGEVFPTPQLRRLRRALPEAELFNLFGPTETNVCTYYQVPPDIADEQTAPIPIGRGCENLDTFVIDDDGHPAGVGVEGTLWVRGGNITRGYWNDAERTARLLRPDPRGRAGLACYTGDRVELQPDGNYRFLGRLDHMIKVRGFRVELGEVESALAAHPAVLEAVATPLPDPEQGHRIVASAVLRQGEEIGEEALRSFCREYLPAYMTPEQLWIRPSLPRTTTGKADRVALQKEWENQRWTSRKS